MGGTKAGCIQRRGQCVVVVVDWRWSSGQQRPATDRLTTRSAVIWVRSGALPCRAFTQTRPVRGQRRPITHSQNCDMRPPRTNTLSYCTQVHGQTRTDTEQACLYVDRMRQFGGHGPFVKHHHHHHHHHRRRHCVDCVVGKRRGRWLAGRRGRTVRRQETRLLFAC